MGGVNKTDLASLTYDVGLCHACTLMFAARTGAVLALAAIE